MERQPRIDIEQLAAAHRAAKIAGDSAGQWWKTLSNAAENTTTAQSLDALFREAMAAMTRALDVDTVAIVLANETGDELVARVATGLDEETSFDLGIQAGEGIAGWVVAHRRPLIVPKLSEAWIVNSTLRQSALSSLVAVPILCDGHPLGVLYAASCDSDRFDQSDVDVLELLADQLAAAIERVRLFETERAARTDAEALTARLTRTQVVTTSLASAVTVEQVAASLAEALSQSAPDQDVQWAMIWLVRDGALHRVKSTGAGSEPPVDPIPLTDERAVARVARLGRALYFDRMANDPERFPTLGERIPKASTALVPIMLLDKCLGVITVIYSTRRAFSPIEREFLEAVADQVAQALGRAQLAEIHEQLGEINAFLARAGKVVAEGRDLTDTLNRLASLAVPILGDICLIDVADERAGIVRMVAKHHDPRFQHLVDRLRTHYGPDPQSPHPAALVMQSGETQWSPHITDEFLANTTLDEEHFELTKQLAFRSFISVPLQSGEETLGSLTLVSVSQNFGRDDVALAEQLAEQVAAVVHKARRYDIAAETSHILQSALLPSHLPQVPGLNIHTRYVASSEGLEVGGDFYDVVPVTKDRISFVLGDVAGHDGDAAALMGQLRSAIRVLVDHVVSPSEMIEALQQSWGRLDFSRIATGIFGYLDVGSGKLVMASAGHYPPLLVEVGGAHYVPLIPSPPLGVPGHRALEWQGQLSMGSALLAFTDGLIDEREQGCDQSMRRLAQSAHSAQVRNGLSHLCDVVLATLPDRRLDDVALLVLARASVESVDGPLR